MTVSEYSRRDIINNYDVPEEKVDLAYNGANDSYRPLTPEAPDVEELARQWEAYVDENVGPQIRLYCYHYFLDRPDILLPLLNHGQPWHRKLVFRLIFPKVRDVMRKLMKINDRTAAISLEKLERAIDKLHSHFEQKRYLAGDQFSRTRACPVHDPGGRCRTDQGEKHDPDRICMLPGPAMAVWGRDVDRIT